MTAQLYSPGEVARLLGVNPKTVTRWGREGRLTSIRTPGGHRRYSADLIDAITQTPADPAPTPVTAMMAAGHYSAPLRDTAHDIRFRVRVAFAGPSAAQYAWLGFHCDPCGTSAEIPSDADLGVFIRTYAQHAGRDAVVLAIADTLKAIAPDGSDLG